MKRLFAFTLIAAVIMAALPASSFAEAPLIFQNTGEIVGLQFYFGDPGLPVDLSGIGIPYFEAEAVDIDTSGDELAIIYADTKDYYYYGSYVPGTIWAYTINGDVIEIPMVSATLAEYFVIKGSVKKAIASPFTVTAPSDTSLIFKAVLSGDGNTVNFALIVQDGEVIFAGTY